MNSIYDMARAFQAHLAQHPFTQSPDSLYEPVNYILQQPGKRLRPALVLLAAEVYGDHDRPEVWYAAMAVEIFHNFTLVHDDIMDEAPLRRGMPTLHKRHSLATGILAGDVMCIHAYDYLSRAGTAMTLPHLMTAFSRVAIEVCVGQQHDMDFENRPSVHLEEYLRMVEQKTAALLGGSLEIGALVNGAPPQEAAQLNYFGRHLGIAFQIQDDWLDTFGDVKKVGKQIGGDIIRNKKTFLILEALQRANEQQREQLTHWYSQTPEDATQKVAEVTQLFRDLGLPDWAASLQASYEQRAQAALDSLSITDAQKHSLHTIADALLRRNA